MNTIILTVNNKENTIGKILQNICETLSNITPNIIIILDGCTDNSKAVIEKTKDNYKKKFKIDVYHTKDIWETKANNIGLKKADTDYVTIVQDDMLIMEKNWDKKLIQHLMNNDDIFSISGRTGLDLYFKENFHIGKNFIGREYPFGSNSIIGKIIAKIIKFFDLYHLINLKKTPSKRLIVNRGPWIIKKKDIENLNYLDEEYAPLDLDDADLCCRAFKKLSKKSLVLPIKFKEVNGSKQTNPKSYQVFKKSFKKNSLILKKRHLDLQDL